MDMALNYGQMARNMKEILETAWHVEEEHLIMLMVMCTWENIYKTNVMGMELTYITTMDNGMKANGLIISSMVKEQKK